MNTKLNAETVSNMVTVKVTHIGQDYGKVVVQVDSFNPDEYEIPVSLALALQKVLGS